MQGIACRGHQATAKVGEPRGEALHLDMFSLLILRYNHKLHYIYIYIDYYISMHLFAYLSINIIKHNNTM